MFGQKKIMRQADIFLKVRSCSQFSGRDKVSNVRCKDLLLRLVHCKPLVSSTAVSITVSNNCFMARIAGLYTDAVYVHFASA